MHIVCTSYFEWYKCICVYCTSSVHPILSSISVYVYSVHHMYILCWGRKGPVVVWQCIWAVPQENQHCGLCVKYRPESALACRAGYPGQNTFCLLWIFCFRNHYSLPLSPCDGMCRPGLDFADCAGLSGSIHYAESIMLVFSWNGSYLYKIKVLK